MRGALEGPRALNEFAQVIGGILKALLSMYRPCCILSNASVIASILQMPHNTMLNEGGAGRHLYVLRYFHSSTMGPNQSVN